MHGRKISLDTLPHCFSLWHSTPRTQSEWGIIQQPLVKVLDSRLRCNQLFNSTGTLKRWWGPSSWIYNKPILHPILHSYSRATKSVKIGFKSDIFYKTRCIKLNDLAQVTISHSTYGYMPLIASLYPAWYLHFSCEEVLLYLQRWKAVLESCRLRDYML